MTQHRTEDRSSLTTAWRRIADRWNLDTHGLKEGSMVLLGYAALGSLALWTEATILRALLAAAVSLFGPGFALMAVLFPHRAELDAVERAALAGGLSLALVGVLGFLLTRTPWGLSLSSVLVTGFLFSTVCLVVAWVRGWRASVDENRERGLEPSRSGLGWAAEGQPSRGITILLAVLLAAGIALLGSKLTAPAADPAMTEFYLLNSNGQAGDYAEAIVPGQPLIVAFGVANREGEPVRYEVRASLAGELLGTSGPMTLPAGESWRGELRLRLPADADAAKLEAGPVRFVLERGGEPYRSLHLWLVVQGADAPQAFARPGRAELEANHG